MPSPSNLENHEALRGERTLRLSNEEPSSPGDNHQLVEETVNEIRATIERIVANHDNTRRLTPQDLINHFIALKTGKDQIK